MSIWQNFRFTRFFISFTSGNLGDWLDIFALQIIFVHEFRASPIIMGFLTLLYFLPGILFGPFAGVCADRFSKRDVMIITDVLSALATVGLFLSANILSTLLLVLIRSSISSLNSPTQQGYIKQVVPTKHLLQASSHASVVFQLCKVLGPILGAVILMYFPARTCLALNVISFVLSAAVLFTLPRNKPEPAIEANQNPKNSWLQDIQNGGKFIWHHRLIRNIIGLVIVWFACSMIRNSQLAIFLYHLLPNQPNALGYILGLDGLGAVVAGTILSRKNCIEHYSGYFVLGFFLLGVGTLGIAVYQVTWPQILFYISPFILGLGSGINVVMYGYIIKKESLDSQVGCVYGISSALQNTALAIGAILGGFLVIQFGVREVYIGLAAMMFMLAIASFSFLRPHR